MDLTKRIDEVERELRQSFDKQAAPSDVEMVYGYLLTKFMRADDAMRPRLDATIILFEELWPEDTAKWKARFSPRKE